MAKLFFKIALIFSVTLVCWGDANSETFFSDSFSNGNLNSSGSWSWKDPYSPENWAGMMVGNGDIFTIADCVSVDDGFSLRLDFDGRNGWCNTCGSETIRVSETSPTAGSKFLISESKDFAGVIPDSKRMIFNKSDNWSRWNALSVSDSKVFFYNNEPDKNAMGGAGLFRPAQEIKVTKACGIDGSIGGNVERRSDCNIAINYLQGLKKVNFPFSGTLSKRIYVYIDENAVLPNVAVKLGYSTFKKGSSKLNVISYIDSSRGNKLMVHTPSNDSPYIWPGLTFKKGQWYYLEEVFTRESQSGLADGRFQLYFAPAGSAVGVSPLIDLSEIEYGDLNAMSVVGNWQHTNDASGYLFFDGIKIANHRIGPLEFVARANPPPTSSFKGVIVK